MNNQWDQEKFDLENPVIDGDMLENADEQTTALARRSAIQLADAKGEWVNPEEPFLEPDIIEEEADEAAHNTEPQVRSSDEYEDLYHSFVRQATRIARLSEEEEAALGRQVRDFGDEDAAKKLVLHNMRLAIKMARQYRRIWTNLMDLVQEASTGLAIAAQRWDPDKGTRFGTYGAYWIKAQLTKFLMTNARLIHTANTRAGRKVYFNLPQIRRQLMAKGQEPTVELIAKEVGEDPKEVALILSRLNGAETSLSTPIDEEGAVTLQDAISSPTHTPEVVASETEMSTLLKRIIEKFEKKLENERDMAIWREHLISNEPASLVDLGKRYGVSKQRMGQLANRIKKNFRCHVIDELGPHTQLSWLFNQND